MNRIVRRRDRWLVQEIKENLLEKIPEDIVHSAMLKVNLTDLYAYLKTRIATNGQFRKSFLINLNFYLMEEINPYLSIKFDDRDVVNRNDIKRILYSTLEALEEINLESNGCNFQELFEKYSEVEDFEKTPVLMDSLIKRMRKFYCQKVIEVIDESGNLMLRENFFKKLEYRRVPWAPRLHETEGEDGRVKVKHPLGERTVSITGLANDDGLKDKDETRGRFFRTTVFMQQTGAGVSHHFNPTNDQATQALGAWKIEGDRYHFVGATTSFEGAHAEEQLIRLFKSEFKPGSDLQQAKEAGEKIVLYLFISKSPCAEKCTPMLEEFLKENPSVEINFFFQQWYESNDPKRMFHHAEKFSTTMRQFGHRVTYENLPLATSAIRLYQQYRNSQIAGSKIKNPFAPMPDGMVDAIYDLHISDSDLRLNDEPDLTEKRTKLWLSTNRKVQRHLPVDNTYSAAAAACAAAPASVVSSAASACSAFNDEENILFEQEGSDATLPDEEGDFDSVCDTPSARAVAPDAQRATGYYGLFSHSTVSAETRLAAALGFEEDDSDASDATQEIEVDTPKSGVS